MSEMVERVARAIFQRLHELGLALPEAKWQDFEIDARAAIAAMRTPTEGMERAGYEARDDYANNDSGSIWRAMIDAALKE